MKIGIFTAMEKEAVSFLDNATKTMDGSFAIYTFQLGNHDAVLCVPATVGEIAASASCQLLISKYNVDLILNFGVVGALTEQMSVCSTVLVKDVVHYDMDVSAIDNIPVGRYGCFDDVAVPTDAKLLAKALELKDMPVVRCASADKFVDDAQAKSALNTNFGADICDMESAGILFACRFNNVPCLLVKCISDSLFGGYAEYRLTTSQVTKGFLDLATKIVENF